MAKKAKRQKVKFTQIAHVNLTLESTKSTRFKQLMASSCRALRALQLSGLTFLLKIFPFKQKTQKTEYFKNIDFLNPHTG